MTSSLHQVVANSLWFAFDALDQHKTGVVDKSRLKELTHQIGEALGLDRAVEDCLADYRSTDTLSFDQFLHFLEYEVFSDVCSGDTPYRLVERYHTTLDALFWEVGRHSLARRYPALFTPQDTYKIFRVFCLLADRNPASGDLLQVAVRRSEVCEVCRQLVDGLGLDWDWTDWQMVSGAINSFPLPVFLTFLEGRYGHNTEPSALSEAVDYTYKCFVGQAFFQGRAYQRITRAGGWLRREIEVTPWCIRASGDISEDLPDEGHKPSHSPSPGKITAAVGRSLTLGRNAVGVMGGAVRSGVTEVVERSRTLTRGSQSPASTRSDQENGTSAKRGFSLGRWGSASGINNKKRDRDQRDSASLGGRESPTPMADTRRSHTLDRASLRSAKGSSTGGGTTSAPSSPVKSPGGGKPAVSQKPAKESTKGIVGGVIGRVWKLEITPETTVTSLKDTASGRPCKISVINTPTARPIVLAAQDHKSKARLLAALQESVKHCMDALPYQMRLSLARRSEEEEEELRACEERIRRSSQADIIEQTQAELAAERTAREEAECLAQTEAVARAAEEGRVLELTTLRQQLEALLQQETQAKRDEEIVRNLQARVLREEWAKREELERLQQEQQQLLEEEQRKRRAFEVLQQDQEKKLREAEGRLKVLDSDRRRLDEELRAAREKIVLSGRGKQLLEARMKVQEGRRPPARTLSLRPSRQERSSPARSSSFTTTAPPSRLPPSSPIGYNRPPAASSLSPSSAVGLASPDGVSSSLNTTTSSRHSASSTPTTSPSAAQANRSILEYLENGSINGGGGGGGTSGVVSPAANTSPSHPSIPEQKGEEEEVLETIGWNIKETETGVTTNGTVQPKEPQQKTDGINDAPESTTLADTSAQGDNKTPNLYPNLKLPKLSVTSEPDDNDVTTNNDNLEDPSKRYIEIKTYEDRPSGDDGDSPTESDSGVVSTITVTEVLTSSTTADDKTPASAMDFLDDTKDSIDGIVTTSDDGAVGSPSMTVTKTKTYSTDDGCVEEVTTVNLESALTNSADLK